jgi:hypothetical protein
MKEGPMKKEQAHKIIKDAIALFSKIHYLSFSIGFSLFELKYL